ncbi:Neuropilin and tolloid-like protein 2 [Papilio machaon]|uniref:Neuropilin and tolloid-like protein 2 n=1 Tax=Papilio machaon TaxID=76193 RepID=A0A0N0PEV3_PAPMA|nr:Neuropilin and tolloid-like protein 2 [Papilio machaon]
METIRTKILDNRYVSFDENIEELRSNFTYKYDDIYTADDDLIYSKININKSLHNISDKRSIVRRNEGSRSLREILRPRRRFKREEDSERCETFHYQKDRTQISHPYSKNDTNKLYYGDIDCTTTIEGPEGSVIKLTFVDIFHIEDHPDCAYDFLEIRDGEKGYSNSLGKFCGENFPPQITTTGPFAWLKFHSDGTIEYEGFHITVEIIQSPSNSHKIPDSCFKNLTGPEGYVNTTSIDENCKRGSEGHPLDVLWRIETDENTKIYLNFTGYSLNKPNECEQNAVQVFGYKTEEKYRLAYYCGSIANPVTTKDTEGNEKGNIMHVRLYATSSGKNSEFSARYTAFRSLDPNRDEKCSATEFHCGDNTCINAGLECDDYAHCRLKADEENCKHTTESMISKLHIIVILVIFSLILSGMSFVFVFKCIRKLYQDHKIIKEHIRQSCEDRLDSLVSSRLTLDAKRLQRDSEPRASLERENHTNEMYKKQRKYSQRKQSSIESDFVQETHLDMDEEIWRKDVSSVPIQTEDVHIERNGRSRRSDLSRKEESIRSRTRESEERKEIRDVSVGALQSSIESDFVQETHLDMDEEIWRKDVSSVPIQTEDVHIERNGRSRRSDLSRKEESIRSRTRESEERKEIRDVSVGAPDTKESGCQTRESLFQDAPLSSDGSGTTNSRGFSTFGYSGATIVRPSSPPTQTNTSQITIELLKQKPPKQDSKQLKKISDRRPISAETTRSAPDVIIVSKPIR